MPFEKLSPKDTRTLCDFADKLYQARRTFLRKNFESYVEDTYYFVPDGGYYCWPVQSNGVFEGFTTLSQRETTVVEELEEAGYSLLGVGASRVAFVCPAEVAPDIVVKIARSGMGDGFGEGREKILTEHSVTCSTENIPIVPCLYAEPKGRFGLYPKAHPVDEASISESLLEDLTRSLNSEIEGFRDDEITAINNLGRLNGDICVIDYCEFDGVEYPLGVPGHIDKRRLIDQIDQLRKTGEKLDIKKQGELVVSSIAD